jgi:hypothetical protein
VVGSTGRMAGRARSNKIQMMENNPASPPAVKKLNSVFIVRGKEVGKDAVKGGQVRRSDSNARDDAVKENALSNSQTHTQAHTQAQTQTQTQTHTHRRTDTHIHTHTKTDTHTHTKRDTSPIKGEEGDAKGQHVDHVGDQVLGRQHLPYVDRGVISRGGMGVPHPSAMRSDEACENRCN